MRIEHIGNLQRKYLSVIIVSIEIYLHKLCTQHKMNERSFILMSMSNSTGISDLSIDI